MPKVVDAARNRAATGVGIPRRLTRAEQAAMLPADVFDADALGAIAKAGGVLAQAVADITHHHIGDPGFWDVYGSGPDELARLHTVLDQMSMAVKESRAWLTAVERRLRRAGGGAR